jgi:hypothetical protein
MTRMYAVSAVITRDIDEIWSAAVQVPTFYLLADVQGIVSEEHAQTIARKMFSDLGFSDAAISVSVAETSPAAH